jgi:hypothetical protein
MRGIISGGDPEAGWLGSMNHPEAVSGVTLPLAALCLTRGYANSDARTRLTNLRCPELPVRRGAAVVALVDTIYEESGYRTEWVRDRWGDLNQVYVPNLQLVAAEAVRWGIRPTV